ncbi:MAG: hypothetical protein LUC83_07670 [Clostridiales bacterium]|nr:hypothetical protein [Clostridiales bacterium]
MHTYSKLVERKSKKFSKLLPRLMVVFAVIFVLSGIIFDRGFFTPAILLVLLYYLYTAYSDNSYEYTFEQEYFSIDVIRGKRRRRTAHVLYYKNIETVAPPNHETVAKYRKKGGTERIKKYDYTSYQEGVPYYTMIVMKDKQKIKLLLDLDEDWMRQLKLRYPQKVFLQ